MLELQADVTRLGMDSRGEPKAGDVIRGQSRTLRLAGGRSAALAAGTLKASAMAAKALIAEYLVSRSMADDGVSKPSGQALGQADGASGIAVGPIAV